MTEQQTDIKGRTFKALFYMLSADGSKKLFEHGALKRAARDLGAKSDELKTWYSQWSTNGKGPDLPQAKNDRQELALRVLLFLMSNGPISPDSRARLSELLAGSGIDSGRALDVVLTRPPWLQKKDLNERLTSLRKDLKGKPASKAKGEEREEPFYIANQVTYEGLDELQRLMLASHLGIHAAIDGPPGTGKTQSVIQMAKILDMDLYTKTCSSRTVESHIISYPVLRVEEGASVTDQMSGPLVMAMEKPGIFYGDEFNLLKEDVQKRLNSAFDDRRYIDRNDGLQVRAKKGFWAVISYNPTENIVSRDLEDSVADRFIHFNFTRWSPDFKAYVSSCRARGVQPLEDNDETGFGLELGWRGISRGAKFFTGEMQDGKLTWKDFFTGKKNVETPEFIYRVYDRVSMLKNMDTSKKKGLENLSASAFKEVDLARMVARFTDLLHSLAETGTSPLLEKIGMKKLLEDEDFELLTIHRSSARIEIAALQHYRLLISKGFNRYLAQSYAVKLIIDQVCYGQYRLRKLRQDPVHKIVTQIARGMQLMAESQSYNTSMITRSLLGQA